MAISIGAATFIAFCTGASALFVNMQKYPLSGDADADDSDEFEVDASLSVAEAIDMEYQRAAVEICQSCDDWQPPTDGWVLQTSKLGTKDDIDYMTVLNVIGSPLRATLKYPTHLTAPADGWQGLVTIPGRKNLRDTIVIVATLMAGKGRVALAPDMGATNRLQSVYAAQMYMFHNAAQLNVNPKNIALLGYSAGAITLGQAIQLPYIIGNLSASVVVSGATVAQLRSSRSATEAPSLFIHCEDDGVVPYYKKVKGQRTKLDNSIVDKLRGLGVNSTAVIYPDCYHHPMKNIAFYDDIHRYLTDPHGFKAPEENPQENKAVTEDWDVISNNLGCYTNNEGIVPMLALTSFGQIETCQVFCYYKKGCVAIDFYKSFPYERPDGVNNCYLYSKACENPLYSIGTDSNKLPTSMVRKHVPPGWLLTDQPTPVPTAPKIGLYSVLGVSAVPSPPPHTSQGLYSTLQVHDSQGCSYIFNDFGETCATYKGKASLVTDSQECERAATHLEGYQKADTFEMFDEQNAYPAGCFMQKGTGKVMINTNPNSQTTQQQKFAMLCKVCEVKLVGNEAVSLPVKGYSKTIGDWNKNSYCADEYELGQYDIESESECAAKCDEEPSCTHFALCTVAKDSCCRLSASCTTPYKSASAYWDGYLKNTPDSSTALAKYTKTAGGGGEKSYCHGEYDLDSFAITDPAKCAVKCENIQSCISFVVCGSPEHCESLPDKHKSCQLSSTCIGPYTDALEPWDGYMSQAATAVAGKALTNFAKTAGSNRHPSYCAAEYDMVFQISSAAECAAKCVGRKGCTHFAMCTGYAGHEHQGCCKLSSTCTTPYKSSSFDWDGYLNLDTVRLQGQTKLTDPPTTSQTFIQEALCSHRVAAVNLSKAKVVNNNLGGLVGKSPPGIWLGNVAEVDGLPVNLAIENKSEYSPGADGALIQVQGGVVTINVKLGTEVSLHFNLVNKSSGCVHLDEFHFTILELNHMPNINHEEIWEFVDSAGVVKYPEQLSEITETTADDGTVSLKASGVGFCAGTDVDPWNLQDVSCGGNKPIRYSQKKRAAMAVFKRTCEFDVKLRAPGSDADHPHGWPFKFTFASELNELCD